MTTPRLSDDEILLAMRTTRLSTHLAQYKAFYSSYFGGISTNPQFLLIPLDDHMVHRGDGVFEAMKVVSGKVYLFQQHMQRLKQSMESLMINPMESIQDMEQIIKDTLDASELSMAMIRVFVSRGNGSFSPNPYESLRSHFFVVVTEYLPYPQHYYEFGVSIIRSKYIQKAKPWSQIKSCNYLQNVFLKKEAVDNKKSFSIAFDDNNNMAESATENIFIITSDGVLKHPKFDGILKGTTLVRVSELAKCELNLSVLECDINYSDLISAKEVLMTGTTLDVLPVVNVDGHAIANGRPGPYGIQLLELLIKDQK